MSAQRTEKHPLTHLPDTEKLDEEVVGEPGRKHLRDQEDVGGQGALEHDGHVGGVEQLDGVRASLTAHLGRLDGNFNPETLQVDDRGEHGNGSEQVHDVWKSLPVEGLLERTSLVVPSEQEVEQGNDGTFEFGATASVDSVGGEGFPDDLLADVCSDEQRDTGSETVALGEKLVKEHDDQTGGNELKDEQKADTGTEGRRRAVKTGEDVDGSLSEGDDEGEDWD